MESVYQERNYQEGDESHIIPLLASAFGLWPFRDVPSTPEEHWRWKYRDTYPGIVTVVPYEDTIASCNHGTIHQYLVFGESQVASYITDTAVDLKHRGKGLYKTVTKSIMRLGRNVGAEFSYTITTNPIVANSSTCKKTWPHTFPFETSLLTRIDKIGKHLQVAQNELGLGWMLRERISKLSDLPIKDSDMYVSEIRKFDERIDVFLEKIMNDYDFIQNRSQNYLNWRFCDQRVGNYRIHVVGDQEEISGYIVFRINKINLYHTGTIVDLLVVENRLDLARALLLSVMQYFKENDVNVVSYQTIKDHPHESLFKKFGFRNRKDQRIIMCSYEDIDDLKRMPSNRVHFPFGDIAEQ